MVDRPQAGAEGSAGRTANAAVVIFVMMAGLVASLTVLFLCMRAVMQIGGFCATGGPYEIATTCPKGVGGLMIGSIFAGLGCAFVCGWWSTKAGGPNLVALAWPALFLSLGYNFVDFALHPPVEDTGIVWGWLICGIMFFVIGAGPLVGFLLWGRRDDSTPNLPRAVAPIVPPAVAMRLAGAGDVVSRLERLAELRRRGDLTAEEYEAAKALLLRDGTAP